MDSRKAIRQLQELKKLGKPLRLAADGWDEDWKTLISIALSARTRDDVTIRVADSLFKRYSSIKKLAKADSKEVRNIVRQVNFYKNKAENIIACAKVLVSEFGGKVPHEFSKLVELPAVGRKTANVFLAEKGQGRIGVDTHVNYISHYLGWTAGKTQKKAEADLEKLFPARYWRDLNWILVRFGQTYRSRRIKNTILDKIKEIK